MKHIFPAYVLRQLLAATLLLSVFAFSFRVAVETGSKTPAELVREAMGEEEEGEEDGDKVYADRPDLALEQDADLTRDPATGTVPRERLLAAAKYNEAALASQALQRTTAGAISTATWTERGPSNVAGIIWGMLIDPVDPTGNTLWVGSGGGGLWKTTNATSPLVQWRNVNSFLTNFAVTTIAAVPGSSPEILYCGTGEGYTFDHQGAGIWKSTDGGTSWAQLASTNNANFYYIQKIVVHPVTNDLYAATNSGLWRSQNGGSTWTMVLGLSSSPATVSSRVADLEISANNTLYASLGISNTDGIYRSTTGNANSWTKLNNLPGSGLPTSGYRRIELACAPSDPNRLYAAFCAGDNTAFGIYRSSDQGDTWVALPKPGVTSTNQTFDYTNGQAWYDLTLAVSPTDPNLVYAGGVDLWRTDNGGSATPASIAWSHVSFWNNSPTSPLFVHADHHAMAFLPTAVSPANEAFFGCDGGVFYTNNASAATPGFSQRNRGLNVTTFYALAMHPTNYNYFLAGAQDNGTQQFTLPGLGTTTMVTGGDGGYCAIDQRNPNIQFTSYVYNQYRRSTNGGASFTNYNISSTVGAFINPFDYDSRYGVLYATYGSNQYLAWTNAGTSTGAPVTLTLNLGAGTGNVTHITVSPLTPKRIYVGTSNGIVLRVDSASTSSPVITRLYTGASSTSVSCVAVDPNNENHLLVTYSNYGVTSVFESTNAAGRTPTFTSVEGALPDMPVRWALIDPTNPARAMLATEMGVYSTEQLNGSATVWTPANNGLVNTHVNMLRYRPGDQLVAAASYGRGLFTTDVLSSAPLATRGGAKPALLGSAYPNPFSSELNLELGPEVVGDVRVSLTDALGRQVLATALRPAAGQCKLAVPAGLASGAYVLTVSNNGHQASRRVVRQ